MVNTEYDCAERHERPTWIWSFMWRRSTQKHANIILDISLTGDGVYGKVMAWPEEPDHVIIGR